MCIIVYKLTHKILILATQYYTFRPQNFSLNKQHSIPTKSVDTLLTKWGEKKIANDIPFPRKFLTLHLATKSIIKSRVHVRIVLRLSSLLLLIP